MAEDVYSDDLGQLVTRRTHKTLTPGLTANGEIRTRYSPHVLTKSPFQGIQGELLDVPAMAGYWDGSATPIVTDGLFRLRMPDAATSSWYYTMAVPEWWLAGTIGVIFDCINEAAGTGNIRFHFTLKEVGIFDGAPSAARVIVNGDFTFNAGNAGEISTMCIAFPNPIFLPWTGVGPIVPDPPQGAVVYPLTITRLGADGADTLAGSIGIVDLAWGRGHINEL